MERGGGSSMIPGPESYDARAVLCNYSFTSSPPPLAVAAAAAVADVGSIDAT